MTSTRRQKIESILEDRHGVYPRTISLILFKEHDIKISPDEVIEDIDHINESSGVQAAPPFCKSCEFNNFDNYLNIPSQCPECRSDWVEEPRFTIER